MNVVGLLQQQVCYFFGKLDAVMMDYILSLFEFSFVYTEGGTNSHGNQKIIIIGSVIGAGAFLILIAIVWWKCRQSYTRPHKGQ